MTFRDLGDESEFELIPIVVYCVNIPFFSFDTDCFEDARDAFD